MCDNIYDIRMMQFNNESDNENGKKRKWFCKYNKREICLGQLAYNGRRQISSQYVNLLHTCKHPKIREY